MAEQTTETSGPRERPDGVDVQGGDQAFRSGGGAVAGGVPTGPGTVPGRGAGRAATRTVAGQLAASAASEEKTRPTLAAPVFSAFFVCGPPASSELNEPALKS